MLRCRLADEGNVAIFSRNRSGCACCEEAVVIFRAGRDGAVVGLDLEQIACHDVAVDVDVALFCYVLAVRSEDLRCATVCLDVAREIYVAVGGFEGCCFRGVDVAVDSDVAFYAIAVTIRIYGIDGCDVGVGTAGDDRIRILIFVEGYLAFRCFDSYVASAGSYEFACYGYVATLFKGLNRCACCRGYSTERGDVAFVGRLNGCGRTTCEGDILLTRTSFDVAVVRRDEECVSGFDVIVDSDVAIIFVVVAFTSLVDSFDGGLVSAVDDFIYSIAIDVGSSFGQSYLTFRCFDADCTGCCVGGREVTCYGNVAGCGGRDFQGLSSLDCARSSCYADLDVAVVRRNGNAVRCGEDVAFDGDVTIIVCINLGVSCLNQGVAAIGCHVAREVDMTLCRLQGCAGRCDDVVVYVDVACFSRFYVCCSTAVDDRSICLSIVMEIDSACFRLDGDIARFRVQLANDVDVAVACRLEVQSCTGVDDTLCCACAGFHIAILARGADGVGCRDVAGDGDVAIRIGRCAIYDGVRCRNEGVVTAVDDFVLRIACSFGQAYLAFRCFDIYVTRVAGGYEFAFYCNIAICQGFKCCPCCRRCYTCEFHIACLSADVGCRCGCDVAVDGDAAFAARCAFSIGCISVNDGGFAAVDSRVIVCRAGKCDVAIVGLDCDVACIGAACIQICRFQFAGDGDVTALSYLNGGASLRGCQAVEFDVSGVVLDFRRRGCFEGYVRIRCASRDLAVIRRDEDVCRVGGDIACNDDVPFCIGSTFSIGCCVGGCNLSLAALSKQVAIHFDFTIGGVEGCSRGGCYVAVDGDVAVICVIRAIVDGCDVGCAATLHYKVVVSRVIGEGYVAFCCQNVYVTCASRRGEARYFYVTTVVRGLNGCAVFGGYSAEYGDVTFVRLDSCLRASTYGVRRACICTNLDVALLGF